MGTAQSGTVVVLVMHGEPPRDFPRAELARFFRLQAEAMEADPQSRPARMAELAELERRLRRWPRTPHNDPFHAGAHALARQLAQQLPWPVEVAFNEFCHPSLEELVEQLVGQGARRILVLTSMTTPGGSHSEKDIPAALARLAARFAGVEFVYAWPFPLEELAELLARQALRFATPGQAVPPVALNRRIGRPEAG